MKTLIIRTEEIVKYTNLNGLTDIDKFKQYISIAQDIHLENYLGASLFDRIISEVENPPIAQPYATLLSKYITPMLLHWAMYEYLPFAPFQVGNKGVFKHGAENADTASERDLSKMIAKQKDTAELYTKRFQDYMSVNYATFPEYNTLINGEPQADKGLDYYGWSIV